MWTTIMNILVLVAIGLLCLFTYVGIKAYLEDKRDFEKLEISANKQPPSR